MQNPKLFALTSWSYNLIQIIENSIFKKITFDSKICKSQLKFAVPWDYVPNSVSAKISALCTCISNLFDCHQAFLTVVEQEFLSRGESTSLSVQNLLKWLIFVFFVWGDKSPTWGGSECPLWCPLLSRHCLQDTRLSFQLSAWCCFYRYLSKNSLWPGSNELRHSNYCSNSKSYYNIFFDYNLGLLKELLQYFWGHKCPIWTTRL